MPLPSCSACDNWRRRNPGASDGTCHLRPPVVVADNSRHGSALHVWPITQADDGCRAGFREKAAVVEYRPSPLVTFLDIDRARELIERRIAEVETDGHG